LSVVYGREKDGKVDEFGTSGYVYKDVFIIYDRKTLSLWYPFSGKEWTAISGPRKGEKIPITSEPAPIPLGKWRKEHPKTTVLLGSKRRIESTSSRGR